MPPATLTPPDTATREEPAGPRSLHWTPRQYMRAAEAGVFEGQRVEMLNGRIVETPAMGPEHRLSRTKCEMLFNRLYSVEGESFVSTQTPALTETSGPEPDHAIRRGSPVEDMESLEMLLVVEVSLSTLRLDRTTKMEIYAAAGHAEYWIVDLPNRQLIVHRDPATPTGDGPRYASVATFDEAAEVAPRFAPDTPVRVADLLP